MRSHFICRMGSRDNTALTPLEESGEEHHSPQPLDLSYPNFIPHPVSITMRHYASSTRHMPGYDNAPPRWNRGLPVPNILSTSHFPPLGSNQRLMPWAPRQWGVENVQMPILNRYQPSFFANESQFQGGYLNYRPSPSPNSPPWVNSIGDPSHPSVYQRKPAYSNTSGQPGSVDYGVEFEPSYGGGVQPQAGYVDPGSGHKANNAGLGNVYGNNQNQPATPRKPHPWELQKPIGFHRMAAQKKSSNEGAGTSSASNVAPVEDDRKFTKFMTDLGNY